MDIKIFQRSAVKSALNSMEGRKKEKIRPINLEQNVKFLFINLSQNNTISSYMKILSQNYAKVTYIHSILDKCAPMYLDILKLRIFSVPKTLAIFLSGVKKEPFSGSFKPCSLMYANKCFIHCPRLASSTPQISANSSESFIGLVSPPPFGILELFVILGDFFVRIGITSCRGEEEFLNEKNSEKYRNFRA